MPPSKTRMQFMVDIDISQHFEEQWREECRRCMDKKRKTPSFSEFMNRILRGVVTRDRNKAV